MRLLVTRDDRTWIEVKAGDGQALRVRKTRHPRARRLRLTVTPEGARVSCPRGVPMRQVERFVHERADWLAQKLAELKPDDRAAPLTAGVDEDIIWRGQPLALRWREASAARIDHSDDAIVLCLPPNPDAVRLLRARQLLHDLMVSAAHRDVSRWLPGHVAQLGRAPAGLRLRLLKSQWGSLGIHDHLGLDLSLALAPPATLHYVLVHELAHLVERNHSPRFWGQVDALMPDYHPQRDWLRVHGSGVKAQARRLLLA